VFDANMVRQGEPGYSNESVEPGDLILRIYGRDTQSLSLSQIHDLLKGKLRCCHFSLCL
jgi:hypothetical protein